jgi:hypothetical protein
MRVECLTEERAPTLGPFLLYKAVISTTGSAKKKGRAKRPKSREETPKEGVPAKYREGIPQMRGALVSHDGLSSLNYVHESYVRNTTFWVAALAHGTIRHGTELNRPASPSAAP